MERNGLGHFVVEKLMQMGNMLNKGYHLFLDNFFTSVSLARYLYSKLTWMTGTVRIGRKGLRKRLVGKYAVGQKTYLRKGPLLAMAWREKRSNKSQFILLSSKSLAKTVQFTRLRNRRVIIKRKPQIVHDYNMGMGGIDGTDQMLYTYLDERRNMKTWKKVIFNIFARMMLNAYILYKLNTTENKLSRLDFTSSVVDDLAQAWLLRRTTDADVGGAGDGQRSYGLSKIPDGKEKSCNVCSGRNNPEGKRRRSRTMCNSCRAGVHAECYMNHVCV